MLVTALALVLSVTQVPYTYQSDNAVFLTDRPTYLICSVQQASDVFACPEITAKSPIPSEPVVAVKRATPEIRIQMSEIMERPLVSPKLGSTVHNVQELKLEKETVFFDFNSYQLRHSERAKLDRMKLHKGGDYRITGFTCDVGLKQYNDRLALKRAKTVRDYLGVKADVEGKGKCCYLDPEIRSKNRRVEIEVKR